MDAGSLVTGEITADHESHHQSALEATGGMEPANIPTKEAVLKDRTSPDLEERLRPVAISPAETVLKDKRSPQQVIADQPSQITPADTAGVDYDTFLKLQEKPAMATASEILSAIPDTAQLLTEQPEIRTSENLRELLEQPASSKPSVPLVEDVAARTPADEGKPPGLFRKWFGGNRRKSDTPLRPFTRGGK